MQPRGQQRFPKLFILESNGVNAVDVPASETDVRAKINNVPVAQVQPRLSTALNLARGRASISNRSPPCASGHKFATNYWLILLFIMDVKNRPYLRVERCELKSDILRDRCPGRNFDSVLIRDICNRADSQMKF
ncbi:unnamed protein product [Pleuronectes platessa]|uniref:Uncharacterized protein n=1 Tax=Pleuronectes platessa TaxID=8262 RepID=A0A9N7Y2X1_PLEPL|nr:unnamed protein product [Pleuronectes platessa]